MNTGASTPPAQPKMEAALDSLSNCITELTDVILRIHEKLRLMAPPQEQEQGPKLSGPLNLLDQRTSMIAEQIVRLIYLKDMAAIINACILNF